jgi:hypothetical protein
MRHLVFDRRSNIHNDRVFMAGDKVFCGVDLNGCD